MKTKFIPKKDRVIKKFAWFPVFITREKEPGMLGKEIHDGYWIWMESYYSHQMWTIDGWNLFGWTEFHRTQLPDLIKP